MNCSPHLSLYMSLAPGVNPLLRTWCVAFFTFKNNTIKLPDWSRALYYVITKCRTQGRIFVRVVMAMVFTATFNNISVISWRLFCAHKYEIRYIFMFRFMVFKATFNNISAISWRSVLLVEETGVPG